MNGKIRLACIVCDREDYDGISEKELQQAIVDGWTGVERAQTYEEAVRSVPLEESSDTSSVLDWFTHLGWCPECNPDKDR